MFIKDDNLIGWFRSTETFSDATAAAKLAKRWVTGFSPDQLITEDDTSLARKGPQSQDVTKAIAKVFEESAGLDVRVRRVQRYENKYLEAEALVRRFPAARAILPKPPPLWLPEPRNMGYFEAMALAAEVLPQAEAA